MTFTEYRFAIKPRLNILPTKTIARRAGIKQVDTKWQKCKLNPETWGHDLNACTLKTGLMRGRHNNRLIKDIPLRVREQI